VTASTSTKLTTLKKDTKDIWTADEVKAGAEFDDVDDPRQQPQLAITAFPIMSEVILTCLVGKHFSITKRKVK